MQPGVPKTRSRSKAGCLITRLPPQAIGLVRSGLVNSNKSVYKECVSNIRKDIGLPLKMEKSLKKKIVWCGYYAFPNLMAIRRTLKFKKLARLARVGQ